MDVRFPRYLGGLVSLIFAVPGCSGGSPREETYTVDYFRSHSEVREAKLRACSDNPGELGATPNCVNAQRAGELEGIGSLRDLPPMGLSTETAAKKRTSKD